VAKIRRATTADLPALIAMGRALHAESPRYQGMPLDEGELRRLWDRLAGTLLADDACVLVAEIDGAPAGVMIGVLAKRWFSQERYATDLTLYVKPQYRGSRAFLRLVQAFQAWAAGQGIEHLAVGVSTEIHAEQTVHAYERLGYTLSGYTLTKKLDAHGD
jgi:GNAT superfamily N-acetyltransferase